MDKKGNLALTLTASAALSLFVIIALHAQTSQGSVAGREVDATTFLTAFQEGNADQYKGYIISGEGRNFHGESSITPPGGTPQIILVLTVGTIGQDKKVAPVRSLKDYVQAEIAARPMLTLELHGPKLERKTDSDPNAPAAYAFSGRYAGETKSMRRQIFETDKEPPAFKVPVLIDGSAK